MFSLEQLIFAIVSDQRSNIETLCQVEPMLKNVYEREKEYRNSIKVRIRVLLVSQQKLRYKRNITGYNLSP